MISIILTLFAAIFFSLSTILVKKALTRVNVFMGTFLTVFIGSIIFLFASVIFVDIETISEINPEIFGYFAAAGLIHLFVGRTFKFKSVKKIGASRTDPILGTIPLYTFLFAIVFLGESVSLPLVIGTLSIVTGIYFITTS